MPDEEREMAVAAEHPTNEAPIAGSQTGRRFLLGLIGAGIGLSRSPVLHEGAAADLGHLAIYRLIDLDRLGLTPDHLPELLEAARRFGFSGLNITYPCKQRVIAHLDALSDHARVLGAVNTVVIDGERLVGHNTDWFGYAEALRRDLPGADLSAIVQFGAGGAGSAVAYALLASGAGRLTIVDTDPQRAQALAEDLAPHFPQARVSATPEARAAVERASGIVNTTPVGMAKFPGAPFPVEWLNAAQWVSDIIYFPLETELLRAARALGCRTLDGSGMNVFQAAEAFRLFTGLAPDSAKMRRHFDAAGETA
jgi:shikimate dehydrogenase